MGEWLGSVTEDALYAASHELVSRGALVSERLVRAADCLMSVMWPNRHHPLFAKRLAKQVAKWEEKGR